jgi:hypothetical protein
LRQLYLVVQVKASMETEMKILVHFKLNSIFDFLGTTMQYSVKCYNWLYEIYRAIVEQHYKEVFLCILCLALKVIGTVQL